MEIKITNDNRKQIIEQVNQKIENALIICGQSAERYAKGLCTYRTGLLRNSITYAVSGDSPAISSYKADKSDARGSYSGSVGDKKEKAVYVGSNVEYAPFIELGTGRRTKGGRQSKWSYKSDDGVKSTTGGMAQPFLRPAISDHSGEYQRIIEGELSK